VLASEDDNPYGVNPWLAEAQPECPYYGPEHGLFEPSTPHPRYIVTGGAGFIGSHLVRKLAAKLGPGQVKVVDNFWRGEIARFQRDDGSWIINPQRDLCAFDLRVQSHAVRFLRGADTVYHLADIVAGVNYVFGHQLAVFHDNVQINTNTLRACKVNNIKNYIYVGTACSFPQHLQMGPGIHALREDQTYPAEPESSYGWSKLMGEYEAELAKSPTFNVGILRFHNVYGPGSDSSATTGQVIPSLLRKAMSYPAQPFIVWGSGNQYRDFVYVDDVVDALLLLKEKGMNQGVIQIGSGKATTIKELAETIADVVGKAMKKTIQVQFDTSMPEGDRGRIAVLDRAKSILDWEPRVSLQQGLSTTFEWMLKQQNRSRVLVVVNGQPRGGELAWKSLHKHLLLPNNAHLATYLTPVGQHTNRSMLEGMAQWAWRVPEPADGDWGVWMDKAAALCPHSNSPQLHWSELCLQNKTRSHWAGGFSKCPHHPTKSGLLLVYRWLISQKIMQFNLHKQYDYIIYSRADYLHLCDRHVLQDTQTPPSVWLPDGERYGGYTDRFLEGPSPVLLRAINITQELVCSVQRYEPVVRRAFNTETLQAQLWHAMGVSIKVQPFTMFTVRAAGDPTSWSTGSTHKDLTAFDLAVKYKEEMEQAVRTCNVSSINSSLLAIQRQHVPLFA
jgi:nucleoside-diphosphate-sugar epimerase